MGTTRAVDGLDFDLHRGETLGIVGESGSGKSVSMLSICRLLRPPGQVTAGHALLDGVDMLSLGDRELRHTRGKKISMVFQDPMTSLNPVLTVGRQVTEVLRAHDPGMSRRVARQRAEEVLGSVGVPDPRRRFDQYPHEFSGGMRQRVVIAIAIANSPSVIIADEPTTALDATVQAQILELLNQIKAEHRIAMVLITHDLRVIADTADRVLVMYAGRAIEQGSTHEVFSEPRNPYTAGLLASIPSLGRRQRRLDAIPGQPPSAHETRTGCAFQPRCGLAMDRCATERPALEPVGGTHHLSACHRAMEVTAPSRATGGDR
jgi:oligopeptide/dipeptide ABC transporter ATP-binding protein